MTLSEKLKLAIANQDLSELADLKSQVETECAPLEKGGQTSYPTLIRGLLAVLERVEPVRPKPIIRLAAEPLAYTKEDKNR